MFPYTDPALVDQAEEIGKALAAGKVTPTVFNRLLRTLKVAQKLPFEAQAGAFKKALTQVTDLENQKKSPPMLREVVERNRAAVQTEADFAACLEHFRDIYKRRKKPSTRRALSLEIKLERWHNRHKVTHYL